MKSDETTKPNWRRGFRRIAMIAVVAWVLGVGVVQFISYDKINVRFISLCIDRQLRKEILYDECMHNTASIRAAGAENLITEWVIYSLFVPLLAFITVWLFLKVFLWVRRGFHSEA
jgi:hypothetical protein